MFNMLPNSAEAFPILPPFSRNLSDSGAKMKRVEDIARVAASTHSSRLPPASRASHAATTTQPSSMQLVMLSMSAYLKSG